MSSRFTSGCATGFGGIIGYAVSSLFLRFFGSIVMLNIRRYAKQLNLRHCAERVNELSSVNFQ